MKSLWNDSQAANYANDPLAMRVYTSRLLGSNPALVLHGGGNTSVKATVNDLFGDPVELLYVKGSGWDLGTIEAPGFAPVRLDILIRMAQLDALSDTDMVLNQRAAMINPNAPNPSVEAILHAIIPFKFVDHSHADSVVTITNSPGGEQKIRDIYGENMLIVPYVMPGFILAKTIHEMTKDFSAEKWQSLDGMILMNHGVFTFASDGKTSYENHIDIVSKAEAYLAEHAPDSLNISAEKQPRVNGLDSQGLLTLAQLRKQVSTARGTAMLAALDGSPAAVAFSNLPNVADIATRGPLTPDHVIRTKRIPLIMDGGNSAESAAAYTAAYQAYFAEHNDRDLTILDTAPRWAVWPGQGTLAFGRTPKETRIITDIKRHTQRAIQVSEMLGGWTALDAKHIFDVEYWELEQAKLARGGKPPVLQGKIAIVTGGASGIGLACVNELVAQGAVVTVLDINPATAEQFNAPNLLGMVCDVTDHAQLESAVAATVQQFGGLDILILNAGLLPPSQPIANMSASNWAKSVAINLTSQQQLLQLAIPYLAEGVDPAVVMIASKNVPAPGPGVSAYSAAKAGATQLARVAALELAGQGIRVNVLHPNAVFDTALWNDEVLAQRAHHYNMTIDEYKARNMLGVEVRSADVAALACAMAGPLFSRTTGAQLPIDGGNERVI